MRPALWLINGRFLSQPASGVQRYAEEIVRALDELVAEQDGRSQRLRLELLCPPGSRELPGLKSIPCRLVGRGKGHFWEQASLPPFIKGGLLSLGNTGPLAVSKQIVCIHDVNPRVFPESYSRTFRTFYSVLLPALGQRVAAVATVSKYSASELARFGIAPASKIKVIPNGHEHASRWEPQHSHVTREASGPQTIVLVGSPAPHKNIALMLRLAERMGRHTLKLAIAGALDTKVFKQSRRETYMACAPGTTSAEAIIWLGRISDGELAALLNDSLCLAFPSYVEGFGLPALEAMALGCPVVAADRASIPEVCGTAALYAPPDDDCAWLENITRLQTDAGLRLDLSERGQARAKLFSWRESALLYMGLMTDFDQRYLH